jgi:hypothetical protein
MKFSKADRMCFGKRRFPDQIKAFCEIGRIKAKYKDAACTDLRAYECPICRGWHLTKKPYDDPQAQKNRWLSGQNLRDCRSL